jgi:hypothetical protein
MALHEPTDACTGHCRPVRVVMIYDHGNGEWVPWVVSAETLDCLMPKPKATKRPSPKVPR